MRRCPCCNFLTISEDDEVIVDICPVCFWQFDTIGQSLPDRVIGPNKVSLNVARDNYSRFGAAQKELLPFVRPPKDSER